LLLAEKAMRASHSQKQICPRGAEIFFTARSCDCALVLANSCRCVTFRMQACSLKGCWRGPFCTGRRVWREPSPPLGGRWCWSLHQIALNQHAESLEPAPPLTDVRSITAIQTVGKASLKPRKNDDFRPPRSLDSTFCSRRRFFACNLYLVYYI